MSAIQLRSPCVYSTSTKSTGQAGRGKVFKPGVGNPGAESARWSGLPLARLLNKPLKFVSLKKGKKIKKKNVRCFPNLSNVKVEELTKHGQDRTCRQLSAEWRERC